MRLSGRILKLFRFIGVLSFVGFRLSGINLNRRFGICNDVLHFGARLGKPFFGLVEIQESFV
jgi:hypothetical protein